MVKSAAETSEGWTGAIVEFIILLVGAAGVFGQLKDALNTIWEVKAKGSSGVIGFIRDHLLNFGMVLVIGFLLLTSLLLTTALAALNGYFESTVAVPSYVGALLGFLVSFGVVTTLFAFIFKLLPDAQIEWRHVWVGAIVTALLFELGKFGLSFYLGRESTASSFGARVQSWCCSSGFITRRAFCFLEPNSRKSTRVTSRQRFCRRPARRL